MADSGQTTLCPFQVLLSSKHGKSTTVNLEFRWPGFVATPILASRTATIVVYLGAAARKAGRRTLLRFALNTGLGVLSSTGF